MAKVRSIITMSGQVGEMIFVNSKAYGKHARAKRGTYTDTTINEAFKKSGAEIQLANPYAKMIKDAIEVHRDTNRDGTFWSRLVGTIKRSIAEGGSVNFQTLKKLRIAPNPLNRFLTVQNLTTRIENELHISFTCHTPGFSRVERVMGYRVSVIAVFINTPEVRATVKFTSQDYPITQVHVDTPLETSFLPPAFADTALVIVKCQGIRDGELIRNVDALGLDVVEVVRLG